MNRPARVLKAFTLLELLVVVSILTVMTGVLIPNFNNYINSQSLRQAQEAVKNDLRTAQNRALTGAESDLGIAYWGIRLNNGADQYDFVKSVNFDCSFATDSTISDRLPGGTTIAASSSPICVFFSMANGDRAGSVDKVYIRGPSNRCRSIDVNQYGLITMSGEDTTCPLE